MYSDILKVDGFTVRSTYLFQFYKNKYINETKKYIELKQNLTWKEFI